MVEHDREIIAPTTKWILAHHNKTLRMNGAHGSPKIKTRFTEKTRRYHMRYDAMVMESKKAFTVSPEILLCAYFPNYGIILGTVFISSHMAERCISP